MVGAWILTPRLILSAMTGDDVPRFHALVTRPRWRGFCSCSAPAGRLKRPGIFLADWAWSGGLCFRLPSEEAGEWRRWIGGSDDPEPEIFYTLTPEAAGRGLAREAVAAFTTFLFDRFAVPGLRGASSSTIPPR
ncbi:GNAT family N-acetyltransferase [Tabrizicola sp.]|uniref:GNAT family N-acetyltransferase n=1 Tax=Tabrizicola sp. TaxID=2005166 RepID=UPI003448C3F9